MVHGCGTRGVSSARARSFGHDRLELGLVVVGAVGIVCESEWVEVVGDVGLNERVRLPDLQPDRRVRSPVLVRTVVALLERYVPTGRECEVYGTEETSARAENSAAQCETATAPQERSVLTLLFPLYVQFPGKQVDPHMELVGVAGADRLCQGRIQGTAGREQQAQCHNHTTRRNHRHRGALLLSML